MVSVIIPTYNRAELIGATLDSILAQTFKDWECIIVDDGSADYTDELLEFYCARDCRVKYVKRPVGTRKGANTCRNYGFEMSSGEYIQWFDSDDLMDADFLKKKMKAINLNDSDFVISKTRKFIDPHCENIIKNYKNIYRFDKYEFSPYNYITQNINWLTPDFLCKRELVEKVKFNEKLESAQERNFFSKLVCLEPKGYFMDDYLTLQRNHEKSIQNKLRKDKKRIIKDSLNFYLETWLEIRNTKCNDSIEYLFSEAVKKTFFEIPSNKGIKELSIGFLKKGEIMAGVWFLFYHFSMKIFGRGIFFRDRFREVSPILNQKKCA